jgi:predicted metalloprotease
MRIEGERESSNIEDRRGMRPGVLVGGGGILSLVVIVVALFLGVDPRPLLQQTQQQQQGQVQQDGPINASPEEEQARKVVAVTLGSTEEVWGRLFAQSGRQYREPTLVLFRGAVQSACGSASAAVGPFYCPADSKLYIDLDFYEQLRRQLRSPGDFAQAYVVAHEVAHHVQNLLGLTRKVDQMRGRVSQSEYNQLSVRLELQADFFAGVWAHHADKTRDLLDAGDVEEAMNAARNIGDDALQKQSQGYVVPDSFTHGTSEQRMRWFMKGYKTGDMNQGDTFGIDYNDL